MKLSFLGGAGTVTGSKYLVSFDDKKILVDCGLFQGYKDLRLRNWAPIPLNPRALNAVFLTHAHIDHSGYIPLLVKQGYKGPIYCSSGTADLCSILLPDSGHLQEEEAFLANQYGYSKHHPALPLYTVHDAEIALKQFVPQPYHTPLSLFDEVSIELIPAGHIIGSAYVRIQCHAMSLLFTGDIGRPHDPIMQAPSLVDEVDYLVMESTYGNRLHESSNPEAFLKTIIDDTVKRGGSVIIPSFAVARAQTLLHYIARLKQKNAIPNIPVYLDSPMAINATEILCKHHADHHLSSRECMELCQAATYTQTPEESKALDGDSSPKIIISASGMATGGRVLFHIKTYAPDPKNTILFAGFQAGGTRGARLTHGEKEIKIHGEIIPVRAQIKTLDNLSAHADYHELLAWLSHFKRPPKKTFITHGEPEASLSLKAKIEEQMGWTCVIPEYQQTVTLS